MNKQLDQLERLGKLREQGVITDEEFSREKQQVLNSTARTSYKDLWGMNENTYGALIHFSVLLGLLHVALGLIVPIVLWSINRDKFSSVDAHGKHVINWMLSLIIYAIVLMGFGVMFGLSMHQAFNFNINFRMPLSMFAGFFPFGILAVLHFIFVLIGGIKAAGGTLWRYPLAITFLRAKS